MVLASLYPGAQVPCFYLLIKSPEGAARLTSPKRIPVLLIWGGEAAISLHETDLPGEVSEAASQTERGWQLIDRRPSGWLRSPPGWREP
jgi:hypothetical protein